MLAFDTASISTSIALSLKRGRIRIVFFFSCIPWSACRRLQIVHRSDTFGYRYEDGAAMRLKFWSRRQGSSGLCSPKQIERRTAATERSIRLTKYSVDD